MIILIGNKKKEIGYSLVLVELLLLFAELITLVSAVLVAAALIASMPANDGKPSPARLANSEFVRLMLPKLPRLLKPPSALRFGNPPNGINSGLFLGSKFPSDRLDSSELLRFPIDGKLRPEAIELAAKLLWLDDCWLVGLGIIEGLPEVLPLLLLLLLPLLPLSEPGNLFCRSCGKLPRSLTNSAHLGSTSYIGFSMSHWPSRFNCGALLPVTCETFETKLDGEFHI